MLLAGYEAFEFEFWRYQDLETDSLTLGVLDRPAQTSPLLNYKEWEWFEFRFPK